MILGGEFEEDIVRQMTMTCSEQKSYQIRIKCSTKA